VSLVYVLDECAGSRTAKALLSIAGADVRLLAEEFAGVEDVDWLPEIGERGWVLLSTDNHIRTNELEIMALTYAGVAAFFFVPHGVRVNASIIGRAFVAGLKRMNKLATTEPRPFVGVVSPAGVVKIDRTRAVLLRLPEDQVEADLSPFPEEQPEDEEVGSGEFGASAFGDEPGDEDEPRA
jgi:hypothetical protein